MKISKLAKILAPAIAALALLFGACNAEGDTVIIQQEQTQKTQKEFPVNAVSFKDAKMVDIYEFGGKLPLFFLEGKEDIPYFVLMDQTLQLALITSDNQAFRSYKISNFTSDWTITITNQTQMSKAVFDLPHRSVRFDNYDSFFQDSPVYSNAAASMTDYLQFLDYTATSPSGAQTTIPGYSNIAGQPITLDWSTQDVGIVPAVVDGQCYLAMPLQTFNDIFNTYFVYNGSYIFYSVQLANTPSDGSYCQAYWSTSTIQPGNRSQALAEYCYNELCMNLDFNYGLKAMHGIESFPDFDHYFEAAGIKNDLLSTNPMVFATALKDVCEFYFGDGHSNYMRNSPYLGKDADVPM